MRAVFLAILSTVFTATGQLFWKLGASDVSSFTSLISPFNILGYVFYGVAAVVFIMALKVGELSIIYPLLASAYIWITIVSVLFFNESISLMRGVGLLIIILGVASIGLGARK